MLIVTPTIINAEKGGGVTLGNLFRGWPLGSIAQIHADILRPDESVCRRYYSVAGPFYRVPLTPRSRRLMHFVGWLTRTGEHGLIWARISGRLRRWLDDFAPEVVFSQTGSLGFLRLTARILDLTGAALVLHASDDWVRDWPASALGRRVPIVGPRLASTTDREWRRLVARADTLMAISPQMAETYAARYGGSWASFGNAIDLREWPPAPPLDRVAGAPVRILYSGSVIPTYQLEGLRDLAAALARIGRAGRRCELVVATGDPVPASFELDPDIVRVVRPVPRAQLASHLRSADILFLPGVFSDLARAFYELSIPGKVAEYLASGRPILVYAPAGSALARSVERDGWAELVDRRDPSALAAAVTRLAEDGRRRDELAMNARTVLRRDFDVDIVRARFQNAMIEIARSERGAQ